MTKFSHIDMNFCGNESVVVVKWTNVPAQEPRGSDARKAIAETAIDELLASHLEYSCYDSKDGTLIIAIRMIDDTIKVFDATVMRVAEI